MTDLLRRVAQQTMRWPFRLWGFGEAIALRGLLAAGSPEHQGYVHGLLRAWLGKGVARTADDHVAPWRELLYFHRRDGDPRLLDAALKLPSLHEGFTRNPCGARLHRPGQPGWRNQIWVDCMDCEPPSLAELGAVTGREEFFDQAADELCAYARCLQDESSGLFFHGYDSDCGRNGCIWARGNGWALLGLVETLRVLPDTHGASGELRQRLQALCQGLARTQDESGLWRTVIPDPDTYLESTLAAMVAVAGPSLGADFAGAARRARAAVHQLICADGVLERVSDATPVGQKAMYATRPFGVFPWGQGPLLLMLAQE